MTITEQVSYDLQIFLACCQRLALSWSPSLSGRTGLFRLPSKFTQHEPPIDDMALRQTDLLVGSGVDQGLHIEKLYTMLPTKTIFLSYIWEEMSIENTQTWVWRNIRWKYKWEIMNSEYKGKYRSKFLKIFQPFSLYKLRPTFIFNIIWYI